MTRPRIGVLALQGAFREHVEIFRSIGADTATIREPGELADLDAIAIPGGESTTMSRLATDLGLIEPVAEKVSSGTPALGTCAGMIMLADTVLDGRGDQRTFGGLDIEVRRNAFGRQTESFEAPVPMPELDGADFPGVFIRAPWVERVGADVEVWGRVEHAAGSRIVAVRQGQVLATAFHPELTADDRVHRRFLSLI